ncbi:MAG: hypothetical protein AAGC68_11840 [Verrucomicrobiota bacterium]
MKFSPPSPSSRNWVAGTAAAGVALASSSDAEVVQITIGTEAMSNAGFSLTNTIVPDLTGDGVDDLESLNVSSTMYGLFIQFVTDSVQRSFDVFFSSPNYFVLTNSSTFPGDAIFLRQISFEDSRINGGARTNAFVEVIARNIDQATHLIGLQRLIFDDASTTRPINIPLPTPEWVDPAILAAEAAAAEVAAAAERSRLQKRLRRLQRKLRNARRLQRSSEVRRLSRQVRKVRRQIRALS